MDPSTTTSSSKRSRPNSEDDESNLFDESPETYSPEMKRLRRVTAAEDYLLNILDEDDATVSQDIDDGLASVMHSLEQEIRSGTGSESEHTGTVPDGDDKDGSVQELGYLLEASDDELGLPPAAEESSAVLAKDVAELAGAEVAEAATMYGQMWGFDDDIGFGSDFGLRPETVDDGFGSLGFDDVGLFDHSEPSDLSWRTMPAA